MIDEKEIGKAAREHAVNTWNHEEEQFSCMNGFEAGANWALQEFKKSLWHDASEEPVVTKLILCQRKTGYTHYMVDSRREKHQWDNMVYNLDIVKWCYVDDILPKEGGEQ